MRERDREREGEKKKERKRERFWICECINAALMRARRSLQL